MQLTFFTAGIEMVILIAELAVASLLISVTRAIIRNAQLMRVNPPPVGTTDVHTQT